MHYDYKTWLGLCTLFFLLVTNHAFAGSVSPGVTPGETRVALQRAIDDAGPGDEVVLDAGVYELDAPLRIAHAVTLRAAEGAEVVLSGGRQLSLAWREGEGGVMRADLPGDIDLDAFAFDQLFLDGKQLHVARYPNYNPSQRFFGGTSADALSVERIATWQDPAGGVIHSLHRHEWGSDHWRITGKNADGTLALEGGWMNNRPSGINPERRFVENIFEELDAPGEWFLDRAARVLYVYPPAGVDLADVRVTASGIEQLIEVVGESPAAPAGGLRVVGVTLSYTARTFMQTNEPLLRSDWMIHRGGAVYIENAQDVVIEDCVFRGLGGNGVFVSGYAKDVVVRGCHLTDLGASGVCFVGRPEAVRSPSFNYDEFVPLDELDREPGPKTEDYPRDCIVEDCLMHGLGTVEKQVAGVQIAMASRITARHVTVYDVPRAGINIGDGTWGGHLIDWCDVFDTVQMTGDHGSFNSWGRDRYWHPDRGTLDRITTNHPELILLDAIETTVIRNSRWRCDHGWDIDLDDGSSNYEIYNNLCLNGGIKLREGFHRNVHNNIMLNNSFHPHVWFAKSHDVFEKNIVTTWYRPVRLAAWGDRVDHNLLPDRTSLARSRDLGLDAHGAAGNPMFIDPAQGDFRVAEGSAALSVGFENFDMDRFGVQKPELKAMAKSPLIPNLVSAAQVRVALPRTFLGATVKQLQGLGERSATGMDSERGVLVLDVPKDSPAHAAGIRANDVILRVGGHVTNRPSQLQPAYLKTAVAESCEVVLYRDQHEKALAIGGGLAIRLNAEDIRVAGVGSVPGYDRNKDFLGGWTDMRSVLTWQVAFMGDASFDVYVEIACPSASAGATWAFTIAGQTLEGTTPDTGGWETFKRVHLGRIRIDHAGNLNADLTPRTNPGGAVMNLRAIELVKER